MTYAGIGLWVKEQLISSSSKGVTATDLHVKLKQMYSTGETKAFGIPFRNGRSHSFHRYFLWFHQLGYIIPVATEDSHQSNNPDIRLSIPRHYYKITSKGIHAPDSHWINPLSAVHPQWGADGDRKQSYMDDYRSRHNVYPTRGRPRKQKLDEYLSDNLGDDENSVTKLPTKKSPGRPKVFTVEDWLKKMENL